MFFVRIQADCGVLARYLRVLAPPTGHTHPIDSAEAGLAIAAVGTSREMARKRAGVLWIAVVLALVGAFPLLGYRIAVITCLDAKIKR